MKQQIGENFEKVIKELEKRGNKVTKLSSDIGYTSTTYMHKTFEGESLLSTKAIINLIEKFNVRPDYIFLGQEPMFIDEWLKISEIKEASKKVREEENNNIIAEKNKLVSSLKQEKEELLTRIKSLEESNKGLINLSNKIASAFGGRDSGKDEHPHAENYK